MIRETLNAFACAAACCAAGPALAAAAPATAYPGKPIRLIVPYAIGGNADIVSRIVASRLGDVLGQQIIIDNRPGASGNIGAELASRAQPDGYTLVIATNTHASNVSLFRHAPFDLVKDFAPVSMLGSTPLLLVVTPALQANTVKDLIALAKARPGQLNYASGGNGSSGHLTMELFKSMTGVDIVHVTYKGAGGGATEVAAGQVQTMFSSITSLLPHVNAGRVRALAVSSLARSKAAPRIPTVAESGLPGFESALWNAVMAPAGTPQPVIARLHADIARVLTSPDIVQMLGRQGFEASVSSPRQLAAYLRSEIAKWAKVVKASGAAVD
jgi:tripartite-type tricarboxylate transporter receptor subunit TctC